MCFLASFLVLHLTSRFEYDKLSNRHKQKEVTKKWLKIVIHQRGMPMNQDPENPIKKSELQEDECENEEDIGFAKRFVSSAINSIHKVRSGMKNEWQETQEMADSFFKVLEHKLNLNDRDEPPSKEEVKKALEQLVDVGRFSFFASVSILPGGGVSLIGIELLARKCGVKNFSLLPSSFRKKQEIK